jgi:hypothetical protein
MPKPPPWNRRAPAGTPRTTLSPEARKLAEARAAAAGRPYPNLIDNMYAARIDRAKRGK